MYLLNILGTYKFQHHFYKQGIWEDNNIIERRSLMKQALSKPIAPLFHHNIIHHVLDAFHNIIYEFINAFPSLARHTHIG